MAEMPDRVRVDVDAERLREALDLVRATTQAFYDLTRALNDARRAWIKLDQLFRSAYLAAAKSAADTGSGGPPGDAGEPQDDGLPVRGWASADMVGGREADIERNEPA